jgi:hypothetical protein
MLQSSRLSEVISEQRMLRCCRKFGCRVMVRGYQQSDTAVSVGNYLSELEDFQNHGGRPRHIHVSAKEGPSVCQLPKVCGVTRFGLILSLRHTGCDQTSCGAHAAEVRGYDRSIIVLLCMVLLIRYLVNH